MTMVDPLFTKGIQDDVLVLSADKVEGHQNHRSTNHIVPTALEALEFRKSRNRFHQKNEQSDRDHAEAMPQAPGSSHFGSS
mmetsp:Transcript_42519/g.52347  ORF Transcript_42519/g.52347 Transcript_42519/m.52347 type:complete len:81 (+) Transcript_42519:611-853(+)